MHRKLTDQEIKAVCRDLLARHPRVTVRAVMQALRHRHASVGRTDRVSRLLRAAEQAWHFERPVEEGGTELPTLRKQLQAAEARAARSEAIERSHQDFWARRYDERVADLERKYTAAAQTQSARSADQVLRLHQRIAELTRRLAQYEPVDP